MIIITGLLAKTPLSGPLRFAISLSSLPFLVLLARWEFKAFERPFILARQRRDRQSDSRSQQRAEAVP